MWACGCAKVLNCRFQETYSLSFVLPSTFSMCHYCQTYSLLPVILWWSWQIILCILLPTQVCPYTLLNLTLCTLADGGLNTFLCRLFHRLLSSIKKFFSSLIIAQHLPMHSPHILVTSVASVFTSALAVFLIWIYWKEMWSPEFLVNNLLKLAV